jgi:LPS-assembly protein
VIKHFLPYRWWLPIGCFFILLTGMPVAHGQGLLDSTTSSGDLFDTFEEDRFEDVDDQEIMKREFDKKKQRYDSLLTKTTPVYFQADHQEIIEKDFLFLLTGNVKIWKDDFKVLADKVTISRFTGEINATGTVEIRFGKDTITGDEAFYNFDTGEGWVRNARGSVEPSLFLEGDLLEKLPDYPKTAYGQYAVHNGFVTACSGKSPDWKVKFDYALVRIENYAHMNKASFWVSRVPVFYTPYLFFPTKTERSTGLLIPSLAWNNRRGFMVSEEFFWVLGDTMDMTLGGTYYSEVGTKEELEWRNAFDQYSRGELTIEHVKERKSPSEDRNPQERWKGEYEQSYIFPWDIRGTIDLDFRSDQYFDQDYGVELEQEADRYMESRVSLTKNWALAHMTLDGLYEKDFDQFRDETFQHIPRLSFGSGNQSLFGIFKGSVEVKAEYMKKEGLYTFTDSTSGGSLKIEDWLERDCFRSDIYTELKLPFKEVAWFSFTPWISLRETFWSEKKDYDPDYVDGSWATYDEELGLPENKTLAGTFESEDLIRREMYGYGFEWTGPRFYRIFSLLGYDRISKIKHIIEPKIEFTFTPEVNQEKIIQFDSEDWREPGQIVTYSITNRLLVKVHPKKKDKKSDGFGFQMKDPSDDEDTDDASGQRSTGNAADDSEDSSSDLPADSNLSGTDQDVSATDTASESTDDTGKEDKQKKSSKQEGTVREFGYVTLSQTYDLWKADEWDDREPPEYGEDERLQYPMGNLRLEATVNPFANIYFSARMEYDPFHDSFSNGYLYGHTRSKRWKFGIRWDYSKNFVFPLYDMHSLALEGGGFLNEHWSFGSWVKYNFEQRYFPYVNLDITYTSQCWSISLHTYYTKERDGFGTVESPFEDTDEIQFGISISLKNLDSVGPKKVGRFWWGGEE